MKRKVVYGIVCILAAASIAGCGADKQGTQGDTQTANETDGTAEDNADTGEETGSGDSGETGAEEEKVLAKLGEYLDLEQYSENNGLAFDNQLSESIDTMKVDGYEFKIGTSYADITAAGYEPTDPEFSKEETKALAYTCDFTNSAGKTVNLGFIGEEGQTVADGELYRVHVSYADSETTGSAFELAGITESSDMEEIIDTLGAPYTILDPAYGEYTDCGLEYRCKDRDIEITFYVDMETEKILTASIEGYAE